ncbi:hypothetical protein AAMO2058_001657400 [Amorphochlora amoebiformis]
MSHYGVAPNHAFQPLWSRARVCACPNTVCQVPKSRADICENSGVPASSIIMRVSTFAILAAVPIVSLPSRLRSRISTNAPEKLFGRGVRIHPSFRRATVKCSSQVKEAKLKVIGRFVYSDLADGAAMPTMLLSTSFFHAKTGNATLDAVLDAGFQGLVSGNIPYENNEEAVGLAIKELKNQGYKRSDLYIQTGFVPHGLQHPLMTPYDRSAPLNLQIRQSFIGSQKNLNVDRFDTFMWDGAASYMITRQRDMEAWGEIENLYLEGRAKMIGLRGFFLPQIKEMYERAEIKPMVVGITCHAHMGWMRDIRKYCQEKGIIFQAHRLCEVNDWVIKNDEVIEIGRKYGVRPEQVVYRYALQAGMVPVVELRFPEEIRNAMQVYEFELDEEDMLFMETMDRRYREPGVEF